MHFNLEVIRRYTHAIEFVEQSYTIENTFKYHSMTLYSGFKRGWQGLARLVS